MSSLSELPSTEVLVVGGGPVGLFLGGLLGKRNISTLVVERKTESSTQAKIMTQSTRTMEFIRQLGFADKVYDWGQPQDWPMNNVWVTSLDGYEIARVDAPPIGAPGGLGVNDLSPEFQAHCPQPWLEPLYLEYLHSHPTVTLKRGVEYVTMQEYDAHVDVTLRDLATGEENVVRTQYLISCEGVEASIPQQLGIPVRERTIDYSYDVEFICPRLLEEHDKGPAWRYSLIDETGTWGTIVAVNNSDRWRLGFYDVGREGADTIDVDALIVRAIGHDFEYTVTNRGRWKRRTALAATYGRRRVYLAGDSAHASPPNGGFGMNTGVADAVNLAWKLDGAIRGWAGPDLLASYGIERRPIGQLTLAESVRNYNRLVGEKKFADIAEDTPDAEAHRLEVGADYAGESIKAWRPTGIHLGYGYPWSPVVSVEPDLYPDFEAYHYTPSTNPGFRAPHVWLSEGVSTLDLFGDNLVLLRVGAGAPAGEGIISAAAAAGLPLDVHEIAGERVEAVYDHPLILVRPDGHIVWRGISDPPSPAHLVDQIRGYAGGVATAGGSA